MRKAGYYWVTGFDGIEKIGLFDGQQWWFIGDEFSYDEKDIILNNLKPVTQ